MCTPLKLILVFLQIYGFASSQQYKSITIGGVFPENRPDLMNIFQDAVQITNNLYNEQFKLEAINITVDTTDSFKVQNAVCNMIKNYRIAAIFGPNTPKAAGVVSAICKKLQIPHFTAIWQPIDIDNFKANNNTFTRNLYPNPKNFSVALADIVQSFHWTNFAIIYDSDENLAKYQDTFAMSFNIDYLGRQTVKLYKLSTDSNDYKPLLKAIAKSDIAQVLIDCTTTNTLSLLKQASSVGMMNEYVNYFIVGDDSHLLDYSTLSDIRANFTAIRLTNDSSVREYERMQRYMPRKNDVTPTFTADGLTTESALMYDALKTFSMAFRDNITFIEGFELNPVSCRSYENLEISTLGRDLLNNVEKNFVQGFTGEIRFNQNGSRDAFYIEVLELNNTEGMGLAYEKFVLYDTNNGIQCLRNLTDGDKSSNLEIANKEFKIMMRVGKPWMWKKKNVIVTPTMTAKDIYEGFSLDLIEQISIVCNFKYTIEVLEKSESVGQEDPITKKWSGMIGKIVRKVRENSRKIPKLKYYDFDSMK